MREGEPGGKGGGLLNSSRFRQLGAGGRQETIGVVVRPLRGQRAHGARGRRVEGASAECVRSGAGEAGSGLKGGGVKRKFLQSQKPPQVNSAAASDDGFITPLADVPSSLYAAACRASPHRVHVFLRGLKHRMNTAGFLFRLNRVTLKKTKKTTMTVFMALSATRPPHHPGDGNCSF